MTAEIFYFSGTGNSLYIARELARLVNGKLRSITTWNQSQEEQKKFDCFGLVFPIHGFSVPEVVIDFLKKFDFETCPYIFAAATKGGSPDFAYEDISKILKKNNRSVDAFFSIEMPNNTYFIHDLDTDSEISEKLDNCRKAISGIAEIIKKRQKSIELPSEKENPVKLGLFRFFYKILNLTRYLGLEKNFRVHRSCNSCGICSSVCPSAKIVLRDGRPVWRREINCLFCSACVNFCPRNAVRNGKLKNSLTQPKNRYTHPEVSAKDIGKQKRTDILLS